MRSDQILSEFTIHNGKLHDPTYEPDLHVFHEGKILKCCLLIPGLIKESIHVFVKPKDLTVKANFEKDFIQIFKAKFIELEVDLPELVLENVLTVDYISGVLIMELVKSS